MFPTEFGETCAAGDLLGMCNSDRLLEYSAVTVMIDHENDDRGEINSDWLKPHFGRHPEL